MKSAKKTPKSLPFYRKPFFILLPLALAFALSILYFSGKKYIAQVNCNCDHIPENASGEFSTRVNSAIFNNKPVSQNWTNMLAYLNSLETPTPVLGATSEEKWIEIDLANQRLYAHEGNRVVYNFLISSGKWSPTPTGDFRIWAKIKYQRMTGGKKELHTFYDLPNVPYVQYFYKGYGLHGAYWHNNFGQPMSHGCINLSVPDSKVLYYWTGPTVTDQSGYLKPTTNNPGTRVVIHT